MCGDSSLAIPHNPARADCHNKSKKKELGEAAGIRSSLIAALGRNESVTVDVPARICTAPDRGTDDTLEFVPERGQAI